MRSKEVGLSNQTQFSHAQGGTIHPSTATINLGNWVEHYGARFRPHNVWLNCIKWIREFDSNLIDAYFRGQRPANWLAFVEPYQAIEWLGLSPWPLIGPIGMAWGSRLSCCPRPVKATVNGLRVRAGWDTEYGNVVNSKHPTAVITRYAHPHALFVKIGDVEQQSQVIAIVGSTGRSTELHLH